VVQHLDPTHKARLAELLQRVAAIPVREAEHGIAHRARPCVCDPRQTRNSASARHTLIEKARRAAVSGLAGFNVLFFLSGARSRRSGHCRRAVRHGIRRHAGVAGGGRGRWVCRRSRTCLRAIRLPCPRPLPRGRTLSRSGRAPGGAFGLHQTGGGIHPISRAPSAAPQERTRIPAPAFSCTSTGETPCTFAPYKCRKIGARDPCPALRCR